MHPEGALIAGTGSMTLPTAQVGGSIELNGGRTVRHPRLARRTPGRGGSQQPALPRRH